MGSSCPYEVQFCFACPGQIAFSVGDLGLPDELSLPVLL
uniref:Uncharacterized protein n=1 Tax=Arundo donax TaxID=35708 RepID=A0A0A8XZL3_ARUDO